MIDKSALRRELRSTRRAAQTGGRVVIQPPSGFTDRLIPGLTVAVYAPIGGEADPASLVAAALRAGCRIALPLVIDVATPLRFLAWEDADAALATGPFGLFNPHPHWEEVTPEVIVTPLVGFDRAGNRLGQGAGHYDRAFAANPEAWRVGVALSVQEVPALTTDPWDVPLQAIVTEKEWIVP